ncbi:transposase [Meridianimarinicoccus zhengii]|uniref:transposase n=1 Tax=Meridianimarinicoccus zhengii TaxID=2056810 RepID=UPI000DAE56A7|nr:transposase [Phycocomes zhengii]
MPGQPAFPGLRHAARTKRTRREKFPGEMDAVAPWTRLWALIASHHPTAGPKDGRPPMPPETMLRVHVLRPWYAPSDPMAGEILSDSDAMGRFAGIEPGGDRVPDETTLLNVRHPSEAHRLTGKLFAAVNRHLADRGITPRSGTLVDGERADAMRSREPPNSIDAPSSTRTDAKARAPELSSTKKGNGRHFGSEAHQKRRRWRVCPTAAHMGVTPKAVAMRRGPLSDADPGHSGRPTCRNRRREALAGPPRPRNRRCRRSEVP